MTSPNRRAFLKNAGLLPVVATAGIPFVKAHAEVAPIDRVGGAHLRVALNAYSFSDLLYANSKDPNRGVDLFGVCDFCAAHDFDAVDLTGYFFPGYPNAPDDRYLFKLKRYAFDRGLEISGTGVRNDFTASDKAVRVEGEQRIKTWIEVAAKLGAPVIRAFADSQPPFRDWHQASSNANRNAVEEWVSDSLRECAEYGKKFGVIVAVQNHGDFVNTGAQHVSLIKRVNHEWCAALIDTGKYLTANPYEDIELAAPYAVNWQIKETLGSTMDSPLVDMKKLVTIIRKSGYRGNIPIETLSMKRKDYDPFVEVPKVLHELRAAMKATVAVKPEPR
jgi:sugar phosphate isomerase/epimerase